MRSISKMVGAGGRRRPRFRSLRAGWPSELALLCTLTVLTLGLAAAGCGARSLPHKGGDASVRRDGPVVRLDAARRDRSLPRDGPTIRLDMPRPADGTMPRLDGPARRDTSPDSGPCTTVVGAACSSPASCCGGLTCVQVALGARVCAPPCTPDDPNTPLVNEDSCPSSHACANVAGGRGASFYCLSRCNPQLGKNACSSGVSCAPESNQLLVGNLSQALCAGAPCKSGKDCPVRLAQVCQVGAPGACSGTPNAFCAPDIPGATMGRCALLGQCDLPSGLCAPHTHGKATAAVGDPCKDDKDCGDAMRCLMEQTDASGRVFQRNGYCAIDGCVFAQSLPSRRCPTGSSCSLIYPGGRCFIACDLQQASSCRNHGPDRLGDYECYAWNQLAMGSGGQVAPTPVCEPAVYTCDWLPSSLGCSILGLPGSNPTNMRCRSPVTGATLPAGSPMGICLDDTSS